jgi:hypothetical protein
MIEVSHFRGLLLILEAVLARPTLPRLGGRRSSAGKLLEPIELRRAGLNLFLGRQAAL